ncbi:MAG: family metallopeptidase [Clostridiales bacterium]|jgi:amidohydrolase|nr:family metallopeptidase [Clostridiales bacterium]
MNNTRFLVAGYVENLKGQIEHVIDYLYENPETSFNEAKSSDLICSILTGEGFEVDKVVAGIKNSFIASYGSSKPRVAYICEYNATEGLGHGCGHNVTSGINMGAGIGLKRIVDEIGGSVLVIGCPSEESYPTKIIMLNSGVFDDIDAVICGHAMDRTCESGSSLGMLVLKLKFKGKEAHTSVDLHKGINALQPCIMLFNMVEAIKSKYNTDIFINGIINNGGKSVYFIPGEVDCTFMIKSQDKSIMDNACQEIIGCAEFAGKLYKSSLEYTYPEVQYLPLVTHEKLSKIACHNLKERGIIEIHGPVTVSGSLDIGNISQRLPVIHPYIGICEAPIPYYSKEFAAATITRYAKDNALKAAQALALTGVDIIQGSNIL